MASYLSSGDDAILTERFSRALVFAHTAHKRQIRKGRVSAPYFSHLLAVTSLVLEAGGNEDQAIAALLHDSIEDTQDPASGVEPITPQIIADAFGDEVLALVAWQTENKALSKKERKQQYIDSINSMSPGALTIVIADKLHNIRGYNQDSQLWDQEKYLFYSAVISNLNQRLQDLSEISRRQLQEIEFVCKLLFDKMFSALVDYHQAQPELDQQQPSTSRTE